MATHWTSTPHCFKAPASSPVIGRHPSIDTCSTFSSSCSFLISIDCVVEGCDPLGSGLIGRRSSRDDALILISPFDAKPFRNLMRRARVADSTPSQNQSCMWRRCGHTRIPTDLDPDRATAAGAVAARALSREATLLMKLQSRRCRHGMYPSIREACSGEIAKPESKRCVRCGIRGSRNMLSRRGSWGSWSKSSYAKRCGPAWCRDDFLLDNDSVSRAGKWSLRNGLRSTSPDEPSARSIFRLDNSRIGWTTALPPPGAKVGCSTEARISDLLE